MAQGNLYPPPRLPVEDDDILVLFQVRNGQTITTSATVGDVLDSGSLPGTTIVGGGLELIDVAAGHVLNARQTIYYLDPRAPDVTGITGATAAGTISYKTAATTNPSGPETSLVTAMTGTSSNVLYSFITPPGVPGSLAGPIGNMIRKIWAKVDPSADAANPAVAHFTVIVFKRSLDGTETQLSSDNSPDFRDLVPTLQFWTGTPTGVTSFLPTDRLVFRLRAARVSGPPTVTLTTYFDGALPGDPTTRASCIGHNTPVGLRSDVAYEYNLRDAGMKPDLITIASAHMDAGSAVLTTTGAPFFDAMVGRVAEVTGAGPSGIASPPLLGTVVSVTNSNTITLSGTADTATGGFYLNSLDRDPDTAAATGSYRAGVDTVTLIGGTFTTQAIANVTATSARDGSVVVTNSGSLGTDGVTICNGTTGVGSKVRFQAKVVGGSIDPSSVIIINGGIYSTNPTNIAAEPITTGLGVVGAIISMAMDATGFAVNTAGAYTVVPTDPVATGTASPSGASGVFLGANWSSTGRTAIGTNNLAAFSTVLTNLNAFLTAGGRAVIKAPGGNYGFWSGTLPVMTQPIFLDGAGMYQTQLYFGQGYSGAGATMWSNLFPAVGVFPQNGPSLMVSKNAFGGGMRGISFFGNGTATNVPSGIILYDRVSNFYVDEVSFDDMGSVLRTGLLLNSVQSFVRESYFGVMYSHNCGYGTLCDIDLSTAGRSSRTNEIYFHKIDIVFPRGVGFRVRGFNRPTSAASNRITINHIRIERQGGNPLGASGDLFQIGSFDSLDEVANLIVNNAILLSVQSGGAAIATYANSAATVPHDIVFNNLSIGGGSPYGNGLVLNAGSSLQFNLAEMFTRDTNVVLGPSNSNRRNSTVGTGSTTSAVVLDSGASAVNSAYVGNILVLTSLATGTATFAAGVMTVTGAVTTDGQFRVGSVLETVGLGLTYATTITSLGTGTGGNGTYNISSTQTLASVGVTGTLTQSRYVTAYVGATKTATVGVTQGSAATFSWAALSGEAYSLQSLLSTPITINQAGEEVDYTYSIGTNSGAILSSDVRGVGTPGTTQTIERPYNWTETQTFDDIAINGGTIGGVPASTLPVAALEFQIDGGGLAIATGIKGYVVMPFDCTVTQWTVLLSDAAGAAVANTIGIDVLGNTYAAYVSATSKVGAGTKPGTTAATKGQSAPVGWTSVVFAAGDIVGFNVTTAPAAASRCTIALTLQRT